MSRNLGETARGPHESGAQVMAEAAILTCSICGEPSSEICVFCTKDACGNHRCDRCKRCSDCCECEVPLSTSEAHAGPEQVASEIDRPAPPELETPEAAAVGENEPSELSPESTEDLHHPHEPENFIF